MLSPSEIEDLISRCKYAQFHGFPIALAEHYAMELGYAGEDPPVKVKKFSPAHLLHLLKESRKPKASLQAPETPPPSVVAKDFSYRSVSFPIQEPVPVDPIPQVPEQAPVVPLVKEKTPRQPSKLKDPSVSKES